MSKMTLEQIVAVIEKAWENHDEDGRVILTMKNAQDIMEAIHHLSKTAERIKADEGAVAYRFLGTDGEAVTEWEDAPITDKKFPDLCLPVGSVQYAYLHPPAQPTNLEDAVREVIAELKVVVGGHLQDDDRMSMKTLRWMYEQLDKLTAALQENAK